MTGPKDNSVLTSAQSHHFKAVESRVITTNGQQYTAAPLNGFWPPQTTQCPWTNVSAQTRAEWNAIEGPKAFIRVYGARYSSRMHQLASKIAFVIKRVVDEPDAVVRSPIPQPKGRDRFGAPWHFLLSGISSQSSLNVLTSQCMWSTATVSFFVLPVDLAHPNYIVSLKSAPYASCESVAQCVKDKLRTIKEAILFLAERLEGDDSGTAAVAMVDSVFVRSLEVDQELVFNVHCRPAPGLELEDYLEWVGYVRSLEYETFYGRLVPRLEAEQYFCAGCKASDHPTGLCPLPLTPGWLGPSSDAFLYKDRPKRPARRFHVGGSSTRGDSGRGQKASRRGASRRRGASSPP
ncbi:hypothetical protein FB45DRAFT_915000 [Roridomyces roridus]|uniref:Uncharacterized protein n=1 Tax=Roridomyces roridus TaxID=1738132 RepID=A0AAD7BT22_9AGAR|nr:hypothetical protein FB45DRAFT_915000 [Roridomyces roridus]